MVDRAANPGLAGTVGATVIIALRLDAMTDNLAATVRADRRQFVDRALEAVEGMFTSSRDDFEREVVIVAAHFTLSHLTNPPVCISCDQLIARPPGMPFDSALAGINRRSSRVQVSCTF
jgi:hypothetical protein